MPRSLPETPPRGNPPSSWTFPTFWRRAVAEARKRSLCAAAQVKRARDCSQAPGSQGAAFRNAGPLGEARTRRSRGARRLGGVEAAFASSRSRSHPRPGSASLFSPHFGTGLRRCRAFSQGTARRAARPAPPATGRPRRPDAAPDTPPRAVPGRPAPRCPLVASAAPGPASRRARPASARPPQPPSPSRASHAPRHATAGEGGILRESTAAGPAPPAPARSRDSDRTAKPQRAWAGGEHPGRRSDAG